jgi:nitrogen-specific signal transduction histidine kinase
MTYADDVRLTYFADPERTPREVLERQHAEMTGHPLVAALLDSFPEPAAIVNRQRQIVVANGKMAALAGCNTAELVGQRMGEAVGCEYSHEAPNGCGTTPACELCGAARAIAQTQTTRTAAHEECRITMTPERGHESLDFGVWTTPVDVGGEPYTVFAIRDTSDEQRRRVLERMFFHDVLNSAGGLRNLLELMPEMPPEEAAEFSVSASRLAGQVVDEIQSQRDLAAAERGELEARPDLVDVRALLEEVLVLYQHHSVAHDRNLVMELSPGPAAMETDPLLLRRVLGNLIKNALEASWAGQTVTVRYRHDGHPAFDVHNETVMPDAVKLQVFRRSFSTKKGTGRGVGTYSARLLTEKYLGGTLRFRSEEGEGTTFTVALPPSSTINQV